MSSVANSEVIAKKLGLKMSQLIKFLCFAFGMAVHCSIALAGALPDKLQGTLSTVSSSAAVESAGLIQRGRDVRRSLGV
ncbi:MAG TPA: hypothetical protein VF800_06670 [Telluria sp.]|jgi:hypothetical protein